MGLKWYQVDDIVTSQARVTQGRAESTLSWLQSQEEARRREREEAARARNERTASQWLAIGRAKQCAQASQELFDTNKKLQKLGFSTIPISQSNVKRQISSGHGWANQVVQQLQNEKYLEEHEQEAKLRADIVSDLLKTELITYDTPPEEVDNLYQQYRAKYYADQAFKRGDYENATYWRDVAEQLSPGYVPPTEPQLGREQIWIPPDETGEQLPEMEPRWWEKVGNILRWVPPNIPTTLIQKYGPQISEKIDLPFMIQSQAYILADRDELNENEQAFMELYEQEVGNPPEISALEKALHPAIFPAKLWAGAELEPSEELKGLYYESAGVASRLLHGVTTPTTVALLTAGGLGGATALQPKLAQTAARGGVRGAAAQVGQVVTAPVVGYEWAAGKVISATIGGTYRTVMTSVLKRNLHSWAKSVGVEIPKATEDAFIKTALANLKPSFMAKEAVRTMFKPTKGGYTVTQAGASAAEQAAAQSVRTSPLLLGVVGKPTVSVSVPAGVPPSVPTTTPSAPVAPRMEAKVPTEGIQVPEKGIAEAKEPWQMARSEYVKPPYTSPAMHKYAVSRALSEGKPVPAEVLSEYPDLTTALAEGETITGEAPVGEVTIEGIAMSPAEVRGTRQAIMAAGKVKGLSQASLNKVFKEIVGRTPDDRQLPYTLTEMTDDQLRDTLEIIKTARPVKIRNKIVIRPSTERRIQTLKQSLINEGKLTESAFSDMVNQLKLPTTRYESATRFISEKEGKSLIRLMNDEAEIGLIAWEAKAAEGLEGNPEVRKAHEEIVRRIAKKGEPYLAGKPADASIWKDMRFVMQDLDAQTQQQFYPVYFTLNRAQNANHYDLAKAAERLIASTPEYNTLVNNAASMKRIRDWIAAKNAWAKVKSPTDITPEEIKLAKAYEKELKDLQPDFRYHRFLEHYKNTEGDAAKMNEHIPDAPIKDLRTAINIYEGQGATELRTYLDTRTWGIKESGYEPHFVINPRLAIRKLRAVFATGRFEPRTGVEFYPEDITIDRAVRRYMRQMKSYNLRPYIRKMERMYAESRGQFKNPHKIQRGLNAMANEMLGYQDRTFLGDLVMKGASQAYITVFGTFPHLPFRNLFQNLAFGPNKQDLIDVRNKKLTAWERQFYQMHISQMKATERDLLLGEEGGLPGFRRINRFILRLNIYGASDSKVNRVWLFWAEMNRGHRALEAYRKDGNIQNFIKNSGMAELTLTQQKQILETLMMNEVDIAGLPTIDGGQAAITEIATEIVNNVHFLYDRSQRAWVEMGETGRLVGSLLVFPRSVAQRLIIQGSVLNPKSYATSSQKKRAAMVLFAMIWGSMAANWLYEKATGKRYPPYSPMNILQWSPGGLAIGSIENLTSVAGLLISSIAGDEYALKQLPKAIEKTSDTFIPFYKTCIQCLESALEKKYIDRHTYRKIISVIERQLWEMGFLDKKERDLYEPNASFYEAERSNEWKFKHALFGSEPQEEEGFTLQEKQALMDELIRDYKE